MNTLSICIMLVIYGRMIEVYLTTSIGPIPLATLTNRDWSIPEELFEVSVCPGVPGVSYHGARG